MIYFTETFLKHAKGKWAGQPLILESWQSFTLLTFMDGKNIMKMVKRCE